MKKLAILLTTFFLFSITGLSTSVIANDSTIKVGFNIALSGMFETAGLHTKNAAELFKRKTEAAGGVRIGDKTYNLEFIYADNKSSRTEASSLVLKLITKDRVHSIIGPNFSSMAIPVAQLANSFSTPMISPWSSSPLTTQNRPYVFRTCFLFTIQGPILTKLAAQEFNATKVAVLFDIVSDYPRGMALAFRDSFEKINGEGSVVAFEEFRTGDTDFRKQLERIKMSDAQAVFVPQHPDEVPLIVKQAKKLGLTLPIFGADGWGGKELAENCGDDCNGLFFTGNYAPGGETGLNKQFADTYKEAYGEYPDEPAALTWDTLGVLVEAMQATDSFSGNTVEERTAIKNSLVKVQNFEGITGTINLNASGNPDKCAVIIKIVDGVFTYHNSICP